MGLPHCYKDHEAVRPFLEKAQEKLPYLAYIAIHTAYKEQDNMFKVVAITHLKNYLKKAKISGDVVLELVSLLDKITDPYQDFLEQRSSRTWDEIKNNILGGLL